MNEWIARFQDAEERKITVGGPEFGNTVLQTDRCNAGIVYAGANDLAGFEELAKVSPVVLAFPDADCTWTFQPGLDLIDRLAPWRRRIEDSGVGGDAEELMDTRPWDRPGCGGSCQALDLLVGLLMKRAIFPMRINQNLPVDGDHRTQSS